MIRLLSIVFLTSTAATAFVVGPHAQQTPNRIFPSPASTMTQKIVYPPLGMAGARKIVHSPSLGLVGAGKILHYPPALEMVGAGIDPTSTSSPEESQPSTELNNPSTRFGDPLSDEMKEFNKGAVGFLKRTIFDTLFAGRDYPRFYALETIARVPYFSYTAALHWYETIGMWRKAKYLKIHFAEGKWCCGLWMRLVDLTRSMLLASDSQAHK